MPNGAQLSDNNQSLPGHSQPRALAGRTIHIRWVAEDGRTDTAMLICSTHPCGCDARGMRAFHVVRALNIPPVRYPTFSRPLVVNRDASTCRIT